MWRNADARLIHFCSISGPKWIFTNFWRRPSHLGNFWAVRKCAIRVRGGVAEWRAFKKIHIPSLKCPISSCLVPNDSLLSGLSDATSLKVTRRVVLMILNLMPGRVRQQIESLSRPCISPNISDWIDAINWSAKWMKVERWPMRLFNLKWALCLSPCRAIYGRSVCACIWETAGISIAAMTLTLAILSRANGGWQGRPAKYEKPCKVLRMQIKYL